jgi:hypothetical protein
MIKEKGVLRFRKTGRLWKTKKKENNFFFAEHLFFNSPLQSMSFLISDDIAILTDFCRKYLFF